MMIRNIVLILIISSFLQINDLFSQPVDATRKILVKTYSINDKDYEFKNNAIVLSTSDSVSFFYGLATDNNSPKDAFLFRVTLSTSNDSSVYNTGQNVISYKGLNEGRYKLTINAFDLQRRWSAIANEVIFDVDNVKAKLMKELDSLRNSKTPVSVKDTVLKSEKHSIFSESWFIYLIIFLFLGAILLLFILTKNLITFKKMSLNSNKKGQVVMDMNNFKSKEEYEKLAFENSELRAEIAALRGQIDAMTLRSEQLTKQNKELQTSVAKLTKSKNELEELQKQKDELFAVVIHDIKNPAALIKSLVELLTSYDLTASEQQEIINDIAQTTSKIVTLSQEVSKILSIEGTKINLNIESADVNDIVKDVFQRNTIAARNKSINIFTDLMEKLPNADIDPQKIDEVIDNLVSNAIKFTQNGGTVRIKTGKELNNLVVEVSDNGLGLSEDDLKNTFKRGSRLSAKPTGGESSTGLGLWIVKKLIESHKGRVWVKSAIGKGSTFAFSIPLKYFEESLKD